MTVTYQVNNLGLGPTDVSSWTDTIWLTTDKTRPNTTKGDVLLATIPHTGLLGNDPSVISPPTYYDVSDTVTLPKHITGQYYITAWADSFDAVLKSTQSVNINPDDPNQLNNDNYKARPITVLLTPPPDLVVSSITPQATAVGGDNYIVSWTVTNQGTSPTEDSTLFDQGLSLQQPGLQRLGPMPEQWLLGTVEHDGIVASNGGSYTAQQTFALSPAEILWPLRHRRMQHGRRHHSADLGRAVYQQQHQLRSDPGHRVAPGRYLQVSSIVTQPTNYSGEKTTVTLDGDQPWRDGPLGRALNAYWVDSVSFLQVSGPWMSTATLWRRFPPQQCPAAGGEGDCPRAAGWNLSTAKQPSVRWRRENPPAEAGMTGPAFEH